MKISVEPSEVEFTDLLDVSRVGGGRERNRNESREEGGGDGLEPINVKQAVWRKRLWHSLKKQ